MNIGIHGIGLHLPPEVRKNDWWPEPVVRAWREKMASFPPLDPAEAWSVGSSLAFEATNAIRLDPFQAAVERRVLADDKNASDMELAAARDALQRSGVDPSEIGLVMVQSVAPDDLNTPNAVLIHRELGLPASCLSIDTGGMCAGFMLQFALAEPYLKSGRAKYALLVQSTSMSRFCPPTEPYSVLFGDGATAEVIGPVGEGRGVLGRVDRTNGEKHDALVFGVPGKRWHEAGEVILYSKAPQLARRLLIDIPDRAKEVIDSALAQSGVAHEEVRFFAGHQASVWLRPVVQKVARLEHARSVDIYPWAGSLSGVNVPLVMALGEREGLLRDGDVMVGFGGGSGEVWGAFVMRWGR
jgi:3-oxoacyl-[acyl-carrier-protein] synthase-3